MFDGIINYMKHLIVIPTYNEIDNIKSIIDYIFVLYPDISILVVDDSSPDETSNAVKILQKKYKNLYLIIQKNKGGLARAYINGFKWGIENGFDLFTSIDADFSHPPDKISNAIELINSGADIASASRYINLGNTKETDWLKKYLSVFGNKYARFILGKSLTDWTEGFNTLLPYNESETPAENASILVAIPIKKSDFKLIT